MFFRRGKEYKTCNYCSVVATNKRHQEQFAANAAGWSPGTLLRRANILQLNQEQQQDLLAQERAFQQQQEQQWSQAYAQLGQEQDQRVALDYILEAPITYSPSPTEMRRTMVQGAGHSQETWTPEQIKEYFDNLEYDPEWDAEALKAPPYNPSTPELQTKLLEWKQAGIHGAITHDANIGMPLTYETYATNEPLGFGSKAPVDGQQTYEPFNTSVPVGFGLHASTDEQQLTINLIAPFSTDEQQVTVNSIAPSKDSAFNAYIQTVVRREAYRIAETEEVMSIPEDLFEVYNETVDFEAEFADFDHAVDFDVDFETGYVDDTFDMQAEFPDLYPRKDSIAPIDLYGGSHVFSPHRAGVSDSMDVDMNMVGDEGAMQEPANPARKPRKLPPVELKLYFERFDPSLDLLNQPDSPHVALTGVARFTQLLSELSLSLRLSELHRHLGRMRKKNVFMKAVSDLEKLESDNECTPWAPLSDWLLLYTNAKEEILDSFDLSKKLDKRENFSLRGQLVKLEGSVRKDLIKTAHTRLEASLEGMLELLMELTGHEKQDVQTALDRQIRIMKKAVAADCLANGVLRAKYLDAKK